MQTGGDRDLFGQPIPPGRGARGRPVHVPTDDLREMVSVLVGLGWPQGKIAQAVDLSAPTLRLHYRRELDGLSP